MSDYVRLFAVLMQETSKRSCPEWTNMMPKHLRNQPVEEAGFCPVDVRGNNLGNNFSFNYSGPLTNLSALF